MSDDIKKMIIEYVKKEYLDEDSDMEIKEDTKLISSGIVDSFSMVSLKTYLEKKFQHQAAGRGRHPRGLRFGQQHHRADQEIRGEGLNLNSKFKLQNSKFQICLEFGIIREVRWPIVPKPRISMPANCRG